MKKQYSVFMPFSGSLHVSVRAKDKESALEIAKKKFEKATNKDIADCAQFESCEVVEV